MPRATSEVPTPEVAVSPALSLTAHPGEPGIRTRKVAILVADGADVAVLTAVLDRLTREGAVGRLVGPRIGPFATSKGSLDADASLENEPGVLFDGVVVVGGSDDAGRSLAADGRAQEHVKDQYRHGKTIWAIGEGRAVLEACGIVDDASDPGLLLSAKAGKDALNAFVAALAAHRHPQRETDPPRV